MSARGANLSPFGEFRRLHLEIGHSRESCRSVKKKGGGRRRRICKSSVSRHLQRFFSPVGNGRLDPPYSVSDWLTLGSKPAPVLSRIFFMPAKRTKNTLSVLIVQIRIRYHLKLQRVYFYFNEIMCFSKINKINQVLCLSSLPALSLSPLFTDT